MKKLFTLLLLTVLLPSFLFCVKQTVKINPWARIDTRALYIPESSEQSIQDLAEYLGKNCHNDIEKARVLYRWITDNIYYDTEFDRGNLTGFASPDSVLHRRSAVCGGYAGLYKSLSDVMGLKVVEIDGYAKGSHYTTGDSFSGPYNHSWIAVRIDSGWQLIDPTWGSGYINETGEYVHQFNDYYFLVPPEELIYSHFPDKPEWQLLDSTVTLREFENMAFLKDVFFKNNLRLKSHMSGTIKTGDNVHIELIVPQQIQLLTMLENNENILPETSIKNKRIGNIYHLYLNLPTEGDYFLRIFSKHVNAPNSYVLTMVYRIIAEK